LTCWNLHWWFLDNHCEADWWCLCCHFWCVLASAICCCTYPLTSWYLPFTALVRSRVAVHGNLLHTGCLCLPGSIYWGMESAKLGHCPPPHQRKQITSKVEVNLLVNCGIGHAISCTCGHCGWH
jgi:hypothetical protein